MAYGFNRFLTTHTGSLPRPDDLTRAMFAKEEGVPVDRAALAARIRAAAAEMVKKQVEAGFRSRSRLPTRAMRMMGSVRAVKLPEGKTIIPGVIESKSNFIEHPELIAQRIALRQPRRPTQRHRRQRLWLRHLGRPGRGRSRRGCGRNWRQWLQVLGWRQGDSGVIEAA
jgi:methionine synthase II (cobalamin-independent)